MSPRLTDWSLALVVVLVFVTGLISLISGSPQQWLIFVLHGIAGLWLILLVWEKLRRVWPRVVRPRYWERRTLYGLLALSFVVLVLGTGVWWVGGGSLDVAGFNLLNWHILLGFLLTAAVLTHLLARARRLRKRDLLGRRRLIHFSSLLLGGVALWPLQQFADRTLNLPGTDERFTGSRESNSYAGNIFPTSSWVADQPRPLDLHTWHLSLGGALTMSRTFSYDELVAAGDELEATLDCTGGFYSTQRWRGIRIGRLLDQVVLLPGACFVSFVSVTGYRWSLPLEEARRALLATHIDDEPLSDEHGFPLRLVAPNRRGFEWVKWITHIEVLTAPDVGQMFSIFTSSFTEAGRGQ